MSLPNSNQSLAGRLMSSQRAVLAWLGLAILILSSGLALGCGPADGAAIASEPASETDVALPDDADDVMAVAAFPLTRGGIESVLRYSTNLEAESEVKIYSEAARQVVELLVEEGSRVTVGQPLLRLKDEEQRSSIAKAKSQLAKAEREYDRQRKLFEQELISEQAFSEATYEKEQLEIAVSDAERELSYATVRSPLAGVITARMVSLGDYVQVNQHLFDLVDFSSLVARVYVPEKELVNLFVGQGARLMSEALGDETRAARIERIAPTVDSRSGTVKITLSIDDKKGLRPGMYVEAELVVAVDNDALLVPKRALVYDQDQVFVYRASAKQGADRHLVERLLIEPTLEDRLFVRVDSKLSDGDLIVVAGQAGLKDGAEVRLLEMQEALKTFGSGAEAELAMARERLGN